MPTVLVFRILRSPDISPCYALMTRIITPVLYVLGAELASQTVGHQIDGRPQRHTEG